MRRRRKSGRERLSGRLRFDDDLGSYDAVRKAVELGTMAAAARSLGVKKVGVQLRLQRLEARLGVRLLERTTRHVKPTPACLTFLARYAPILAQVKAARVAVVGGPPATAPAVPTTVAAAPPMSAAAVAALPGQLDVTLRRVEGGQWAAVCFQTRRVVTGPDPARLLALLADGLAEGERSH
jgi:DNA-binding transcriptional LysR family regulator